MKIAKWLFVAMLGLVAAFFGVALVLPDSTHVERDVVVDARPATVYAVLDGFRRFNEWSPWADLDPKTRYVYEGPLAGVGARMSWNSEDPNVGSGMQEILEAVPAQKIRNKLVFGDFSSENYATYTLAPEGEGTRVTWSYDSTFHGNLVYRWFGLMMDGMIGPDYEKGLARLKTLADALPKDDFSGLEVQLVSVPATPLALAHGEAVAEQSGPVLAALQAQIREFVAGSGSRAASAPIAITRAFNEGTHAWSFDAALPLEQPCTSAADAPVQCATSYAGAALRATHRGPYASLEKTYAQLIAYRTVAGLKDNGDSWEHYVTDPATTPEGELVTHVYWPVQ